MIQCVNLTKRYAKREVIKDLSFSIADGEFVCFSGTSGSGFIFQNFALVE